MRDGYHDCQVRGGGRRTDRRKPAEYPVWCGTGMPLSQQASCQNDVAGAREQTTRAYKMPQALASVEMWRREAQVGQPVALSRDFLTLDP